jgi:hypothetical protein
MTLLRATVDEHSSQYGQVCEDQTKPGQGATGKDSGRSDANYQHGDNEAETKPSP